MPDPDEHFTGLAVGPHEIRDGLDGGRHNPAEPDRTIKNAPPPFQRAAFRACGNNNRIAGQSPVAPGSKPRLARQHNIIQVFTIVGLFQAIDQRPALECNAAAVMPR